MAKKVQKETVKDNMTITRESLAKKIEAKLFSRGITDPKTADKNQIYQATVAAIKDFVTERRNRFKKREKATAAK